MRPGSRDQKILHWNVTEHPTADWTAQQFRLIVPADRAHRFVIHDRHTIYAERVDRTLEAMGLSVLTTPARVPQANTFCERLIGTIRRSRVLGLRHSDNGASPSRHASRVDRSLQSETATPESGARYSRMPV
jgi:hypothetical protein